MEYAQAIKEIESGALKPIYLLFADEPLLAEDILGALIKQVVPDPAVSAFTLFRYDADTDDADSAVAEMRTVSFFGTRKLSIVKTLGATKNSLARWEPSLTAYAESPNPDTVCVILTASELPAKNKLRLACRKTGAVVKCSRLKGRAVGDWARKYIEQRGKKVAPSAVWALQTLSGPSLGVLQGELEKLLAYVGDNDSVSSEDIQKVCTDASELRVFAAIDAITAGNSSQALSDMGKLLGSGEVPARVFGALAANLRSIARAYRLRKSGLSAAQAQKAMGGHPFAASKAIKACARIDDRKLEAIYESLVAADMGLKSGLDPMLALQILVAELAPHFSR